MKLNNIKKNLGEFELKDISLNLPDVGFVVINGESGSGKTTLLNIISMRMEAEGSIVFKDKEILSLNRFEKDKLRRKYFSNISQNFILFENKTVYENLSFVTKDKEKISNLLLDLGLNGLENSIVSDLSGGERQKVCLVRALINDTMVVCLDEPTSNIDEKNSLLILEKLKQVSKNKLVIMVCHNDNLITKYADRIITLDNGSVKNDIEISCNNNAIVEKDKIYKDKNKKNNIILGVIKTSLESKKAKIVGFSIVNFIAILFLVFFFSIIFTTNTFLIRKNLKHLGLQYYEVKEKTDNSYYMSTLSVNPLAFMNFEKEDIKIVNGRVPQNTNECIISESSSKMNNYNIGDKVPFVSTGVFLEFQVVGIYESDLSAYEYEDSVENKAYQIMFTLEETLEIYESKLDKIEYYPQKYVKKLDRNKFDKNNLLCGDMPKEKNQILITTYLMQKLYNIDENELSTNLDYYFSKLDKNVKIRTYDYIVVGVTSYYADYLIEENIAHLDYFSSYVEAVDNIEADNLGSFMMGISNKLFEFNKYAKLVGGIVILIILSVMSIIIYNFIKHTIDENKQKYKVMYECGVSKFDIMLSVFFEKTIVIFAGLLIFLILGLPLLFFMNSIVFNFGCTLFYFVIRFSAIVLSLFFLLLISFIVTLLMKGNIVND